MLCCRSYPGLIQPASSLPLHRYPVIQKPVPHSSQLSSEWLQSNFLNTEHALHFSSRIVHTIFAMLKFHVIYVPSPVILILMFQEWM